jgi:DNA-binding CsgD family transcriptional regulator
MAENRRWSHDYRARLRPCCGASVSRPPLTDRQREIARMLADGKSPKQVSVADGISLRTVRWYIRQIAGRIDGTGPALTRIRVAVWRGEGAFAP